MPHPYSHLPETAFWRSAVANREIEDIGPLWKPRHPLRPTDRIVTFGSCFSQRIGAALIGLGYNWVSTEPPPPDFDEAEARRFNYNIFSCRVANIYTASMLRQWTRWALLEEAAPDEAWESEGRWFDPFRPAIEPGGFASREEMEAMRAVTIRAFREAVETADYFIFTLGLTETWRRKGAGYEYSACPGTAAGEFDPDLHESHGLDVVETVQCLTEAFALMRARNPELRVILTVSPVPIAATVSGDHVLLATTRSKSILRAAADHMTNAAPYIDYFPGYEMIVSPSTRGKFFSASERQVPMEGVDFVMRSFIAAQGGARVDPAPPAPAPARAPQPTDLVCEEELLDAFAPSR